MTRYKLIIEYDGKNFCGWQKQKNMVTVQGTIEESLYKFFGKTISIYGAGRTDTGVHASGQVAHFDMEQDKMEDSKTKLGKLTMGLNFYLSRQCNNEISIVNTIKVNNEFHARFSAKGRKYKYTILNRRTASPLFKDKTWRVPLPLNLELMKESSKYLIGKHDFSAFRSIDCQAKSPIKTIDNIIIKNNNELVEIYVEAKSFLMNQVRIIAGTLVDVGLLKKTGEDVLRALEYQNKNYSGPTAPPNALILEKVNY
jgi:tRNA pseudouridine38-40 synthase